MRWATAQSAAGAGIGAMAAAAAIALLLMRAVPTLESAPSNAAAPATRPALAADARAVAAPVADRTWRDGPLGPIATRVEALFDVPTLSERSRTVERVAIVERPER